MGERGPERHLPDVAVCPADDSDPPERRSQGDRAGLKLTHDERGFGPFLLPPKERTAMSEVALIAIHTIIRKVAQSCG